MKMILGGNLMLRKKGYLLILALIFVFSISTVAGAWWIFGSDEQATWDKVQAEGKLVVGMDAAYKPFEYQDKNGEIVGFDVDVLKEVAKKLDIKLDLQNTSFDGIIPGLQAKKYDLIMSAMTITEERKKAVNFSDPYFNAGQVIAAMGDNSSVKGVKDLEDKIVAVQLGTTGDLKVSEMEGVKEIKRFDTIPEAFIALQNGQVEAVVNDLPVTAAYIKEHPEVKIVGEPFTTEYYGIAFRKEDTELKEKINEALAELKQDGTYDEIYAKWFE